MMPIALRQSLDPPNWLASAIGDSPARLDIALDFTVVVPDLKPAIPAVVNVAHSFAVLVADHLRWL